MGVSMKSAGALRKSLGVSKTCAGLSNKIERVYRKSGCAEEVLVCTERGGAGPCVLASSKGGTCAGVSMKSVGVSKKCADVSKKCEGVYRKDVGVLRKCWCAQQGRWLDHAFERLPRLVRRRRWRLRGSLRINRRNITTMVKEYIF